MHQIYADPIAQLAVTLNIPYPVLAILLAIVGIWTIIWKGFGLWRAARNEQFWWFFFMLIINDLGVLEIVYLLWFRADKNAIVTRVVGDSSVLPEKE